MIDTSAGRLLQIWEQGAARSASVRAQLLLRAVFPESKPEELCQLSVGHRDASLLSLRQQMFGAQLECLTQCTTCGEQIELRFPADAVRTVHAEPGATHAMEADGFGIRFRVPSGADLLALAGSANAQAAERELLSRCVLEIRAQDRAVTFEELPASACELLERRMGEIDAQAQVQLDIDCPSCGRNAQATFDIVTHLWAELEAWARRLLVEINDIACRYGWSEAQILALSAARRRAYLELIGA
jgi:hypothetical protein